MQFTAAGMQEPLASRWALRHPTRPLQLGEGRDRASLDIMSTYRLLRCLVGADWRWQRWVPPSRRSRASRELSLGYAPGGERVWCTSGVEVPRNYVLTLLCAEDGADLKGCPIPPQGYFFERPWALGCVDS